MCCGNNRLLTCFPMVRVVRRLIFRRVPAVAVDKVVLRVACDINPEVFLRFLLKRMDIVFRSSILSLFSVLSRSYIRNWDDRSNRDIPRCVLVDLRHKKPNTVRGGGRENY